MLEDEVELLLDVEEWLLSEELVLELLLDVEELELDELEDELEDELNWYPASSSTTPFLIVDPNVPPKYISAGLSFSDMALIISAC